MTSTSYNFTGGLPVATQLRSDFALVNEWHPDELSAFTRDVLLAALLSSSAKSENELIAAFTTTYPQHKQTARSILTSLIQFFMGTMKHSQGQGGVGGLDGVTKSIERDLASLGLDATKGEMLGKNFLTCFAALTENAMAQSLTVNQLVDINWKFLVTASSSEMSQLGACSLQIQMIVQKGEKKENVIMGKKETCHTCLSSTQPTCSVGSHFTYSRRCSLRLSLPLCVLSFCGQNYRCRNFISSYSKCN